MMTAMYALPETFMRSIHSGWFSVCDSFDLRRKMPGGYDSIRCREGLSAANGSANGTGSGTGMYGGWNSQLLRKLQDKFSFRLDHIRWLQDLVLEHKVPTSITLHFNDFRALREDLEDSVIETLIGDKFIVKEKLGDRIRRFDHSSDPIEILSRTDWFAKRDVINYSSHPDEEKVPDGPGARIPMTIGEIKESVVEVKMGSGEMKASTSRGCSPTTSSDELEDICVLSKIVSEEMDNKAEKSSPSPTNPTEDEIVDLERELLLKLTGDNSLTVVPSSSNGSHGSSASTGQNGNNDSSDSKLKFKLNPIEEPTRVAKIGRLGDRLAAAYDAKEKARKQNATAAAPANISSYSSCGSNSPNVPAANSQVPSTASGGLIPPIIKHTEQPSVKLGDRLAAVMMSKAGVAAFTSTAPVGTTVVAGSSGGVPKETTGHAAVRSKPTAVDPKMRRAIDQIVTMVKVSTSTNSVIQVLKEFGNLKTLLLLLATKQSSILQQLVNLIRNTNLTLPPDAVTALREKLLKFVMQNAIEVAKDASGDYDPTNPDADADPAVEEPETDFTDSIGKVPKVAGQPGGSNSTPGPSNSLATSSVAMTNKRPSRFGITPEDGTSQKKMRMNEILQKVEARRLMELKRRKGIPVQPTSSEGEPGVVTLTPGGSNPVQVTVSGNSNSAAPPSQETVESLKAQVEQMKKMMEQMQQQRQPQPLFPPVSGVGVVLSIPSPSMYGDPPVGPPGFLPSGVNENFGGPFGRKAKLPLLGSMSPEEVKTSNDVLPKPQGPNSDNAEMLLKYQKYFQRPKPHLSQNMPHQSTEPGSSTNTPAEETSVNPILVANQSFGGNSVDSCGSFGPRGPNNSGLFPPRGPSANAHVGFISGGNLHSAPHSSNNFGNNNNSSPPKVPLPKPTGSPRKLMEPYLSKPAFSKDSSADAFGKNDAKSSSADVLTTSASPIPSSNNSGQSTISSVDHQNSSISSRPGGVPPLPSLLSLSPTQAPIVRPVPPRHPASVFMTNLVHADTFSAGKSPFPVIPRGPRPSYQRPPFRGAPRNFRPSYSYSYSFNYNNLVHLQKKGPGNSAAKADSLNSEEELVVIDIIEDLAKDSIPSVVNTVAGGKPDGGGGGGAASSTTTVTTTAKQGSTDAAPEIVTIIE